MLNDAIGVLQTLGILDVIKVVAVSMGAMFLYRYFFDKG